MYQQRSPYKPFRANRKSRKILLLLGTLSTVVFLMVTVGVLLYGSQKQKLLFPMETQQISQSWADDEGNTLSLPVKLPYPKNGRYSMATNLKPEDIAEGSISLFFSAKYLNVSLFLNDEELGSSLCLPEGYQKTIGKTFLIVPLPKDFLGGELRIEAVPLLGEFMNYEIVAPIIGSEGQLVYELIYNDLAMLLTVTAIFCFGILLFLFGFQARGTNNGTFLQIGLFAILFSLYSFAITDAVHLFTANSVLIYLLEFLLLTMFPMPLLALMYLVCIPRFQKILLIDLIALFLNFILQALLYYFTNIELRAMVQYTHALMLLSVALLIPILLQSRQQGAEWFRLLLSFLPIIVGVLWDLCRFYLPGSYQKALGVQVGVLIFILMQTFYLIHSYFEYYKRNLEYDWYRQMAYTDALTGLFNRAAFEEKIKELQDTIQSYSEIWCICADVNNLKKINDFLGHAKGDELIRAAAMSLRTVMCANCQLYRTGGDEFVMFITNRTEDKINAGCAEFEAELKRYNHGHDVMLSVALGYERFRPEEEEDSIMHLITRADVLMYENKRKWKEEIKKEEKMPW